MPDITVSFTDAQWTRIVAASKRIKKPGEDGNVDVAYLANMWKTRIGILVQQYEESLLSANDF